MTPLQISDMRSLLGKLAWIAVGTVPVLSCTISAYQGMIAHEPTCKLIKDIIAIVELLQREPPVVTIPYIGPPSNWSIVCFVDAAFKTMPQGKSQMGSLTYLVPTDKIMPYTYYPKSYGLVNKAGTYPEVHCPAPLLDWESHRITRVASSSYQAELLGLKEQLDNIRYLVNSIRSITGVYLWNKKVTVYTDARDVADVVRVSNPRPATVNTVTDLFLIRESHKFRHINLMWINNIYQMADWLTKNLFPTTVKGILEGTYQHIKIPDYRELKEKDIGTTI